MIMAERITQELRRSRQVGQRAVFLSVDGSGTELRLPTELDRGLQEPATLFVVISQDVEFEDDAGAGDGGAEAGAEEREAGADQGAAEDTQAADGEDVAEEDDAAAEEE